MSQMYYKILGISSSAGMQEIKTAYRRLAKKFHPDISKDPQAKDKFILINEAYEFLIDLKKRDAEKGHKNISRQQADELYRQWLRKERIKARARAAEEARRKFDEFRKSPIYKTTRIIFTFYDVLSMLIGLLIIIASAAGLLISFHSPKGISPNNIVAFIFLVFLGTLFIFFSVASIRQRYRRV